MSLNMDRGLKVRDDASDSLAEPFLFSTIYLAPTSENGEWDARTELLLCPGLVSRASDHTAVPHPEQ